MRRQIDERAMKSTAALSTDAGLVPVHASLGADRQMSDSITRAVGNPHPKQRWALTMVCALIVTVVGISGIEMVWRLDGYQPTVPNTPALWAFHRRRLDHAGERGVALLGTSRMLVDFSMDAFGKRFPSLDAAQLAIESSSPVKILEDLAADPRFRGTVISEFCEEAFVPHPQPKYFKEGFVELSHQSLSWATELNDRIDGSIQERLCCRNPDFGLNKVFVQWVQNSGWPIPTRIRVRFDRHQLVDYRIGNLDEARAETYGRVRALYAENMSSLPTPDDWLKQALQIESVLQRFRAKGCRVAFIRFPCTNETWDLENRYFPKVRCWDRFAAATSAVTIHFREVPKLAHVECPDSCHLDFRDTDDFTNNLLDELVKKGFFGK
jgi:hypothetical protein